MFGRTLVLGLVVALAAGTASGPLQADIYRVREAPSENLKRHYDELIRQAERNNRDAAHRAALEMAKAINDIYSLAGRVPDEFRGAGMRDLETKAKAYMDAMADLRRHNARLADKLKTANDSYSSELSAIKSARRRVDDTMYALWSDMTNKGRQLRAEAEALRKTCSRGCL